MARFLFIRDRFILSVLAFFCAYSALALTPSSYGIILAQFGEKTTGVILGKPREIRSDEYSVNTPEIQIAVNNGFKRFNETSIYREDLRQSMATPILDWGLPFKPQFWPFFVVNPATAFSLYFSFFMAGFLIGYYLLLRAFRFEPTLAGAGSLLLFFSAYAQFWWTSFGPQLAIFPWVILAFLSPLKKPAKFALIFYLLTVWLISFLYVATLSAYLVAGFLAVLAFRREKLTASSIAVAGAAVAAAGGTAYLYLHDWIEAISRTGLGHRSLSGGSVSLTYWFSQFFPLITLEGFHYETNLPTNICEGAAAGSYLFLNGLVFLDFKAWAPREHLRKIAPLLVGFVLLSGWMLFHLPLPFFHFLHWDLAGANRLFFASGFLLCLIGLTLFGGAAVKITPARVLLLGAVNFGLLWYYKAPLLHPPFKNVMQVAGPELLLFAAPGLFLAMQRHLEAWRRYAPIFCAVLVNVATYAPFNPVQSAVPIFNREETPITHAYHDQCLHHPRGWLTAPVVGSVLNGWGFKAVAHTLPQPSLAFFHGVFPGLKAAEFDRIFNRWGYILPANVRQPLLENNELVIEVPAMAFQ